MAYLQQPNTELRMNSLKFFQSRFGNMEGKENRLMKIQDHGVMTIITKFPWATDFFLDIDIAMWPNTIDFMAECFVLLLLMVVCLFYDF